MATAKMRKHFILEGQVQGVGLRFRAEYATQRIPVTGWIKNCEDGVVELELQGSEEDINRFVAELEKGRYVQVEKRIVKDLPLVEDEVGFKVLE